jgi:hypothetical protein
VFLCTGLGEMLSTGSLLMELVSLLVTSSIKLFLDFKYKDLFELWSVIQEFAFPKL